MSVEEYLAGFLQKYSMIKKINAVQGMYDKHYKIPTSFTCERKEFFDKYTWSLKTRKGY